MPHSEEQNQKWPTNGRLGYLTPAIRQIYTASEWGAKSTLAHKCGNGYVTATVKRGLQHFRAGNKIRIGPQRGRFAT